MLGRGLAKRLTKFEYQGIGSFQPRSKPAHFIEEKEKNTASQDVCAAQYESNQENHLKLVTWQPAGGSYQARGCVQTPDGRRYTRARRRVNISCGQTRRQKLPLFFLFIFSFGDGGSRVPAGAAFFLSAFSKSADGRKPIQLHPAGRGSAFPSAL